MFLKQSNIQIELEREQSSSLPVLIQLVQNISRWDSLQGTIDTVAGFNRYRIDPQRPGTIGNYSYAFTIEVPNINPGILSDNFKTLYNMMTSGKSIKISRRELFDKFYIFKLPDFGNQTMSIGMLDFVPFCYVNGLKLGQDKIGMIRSFNSKEIYLLFDKSDSDNVDFSHFGYFTRHNGIIDKTKLLTVYINYKRYYSNGSVGLNMLPESSFDLIKLTYNKDTNFYEGTVTTKFNKLTEESIRNISVFIRNLDSSDFYYKVMNNSLFKNIIINGINLEEEIVSRQAERTVGTYTYDGTKLIEDNDINKKERDFFKLVAETLYNISKSYLYGNGEQFEEISDNSKITFDIKVKNFLYTTDRNEMYIGSSENMTSSLLLSNIKNVSGYHFSEVDQFDLYEKVGTGYKKLVAYNDFYPIFDSASSDRTSGICICGFKRLDASGNTITITNYEVIPHYDDRKRIEICKKLNVAGENVFNIHNILKDDKIFKYNLDLSKCEIEVYIDGSRIVNTYPSYINLKTNQSLINLITEFDKLYDDNHNLISGITSVSDLRSEILSDNRNIYLYDSMTEYSYFDVTYNTDNWHVLGNPNSDTLSVDNLDKKPYNALVIRNNDSTKNKVIEIIIKYDNLYSDNSSDDSYNNLCCFITDAGGLTFKAENTTENIINDVALVSDVILKYRNKYKISFNYNYTVLTDPTINVVNIKEEDEENLDANIYDNMQSEQDFYLYHGYNKYVDVVLQDGEPRIYTNTVEDDTSESMRNKFIVSTTNKANSENIISDYNTALTNVKTKLEYFYGYEDIPNNNDTDKAYAQQMQEKYKNLELSIKNIKDSVMEMFFNSSENMINYTFDNNITERFMAIVFELDNNNPINLIIRKNNIIEKIEYSCIPRTYTAYNETGEPINKYYYIHLPYYFFNDDTSKMSLNYTLENDDNVIKSYQIMY